MPDDHAPRFERQTRFAPLGPAGQARLEASRVVLVGCGALGGVLAQCLARAGVGELVLVDRDVVELSNLPRQVLFDERHARESTPKALAAAETLARIGGPTRLVPEATHLDARNVGELARGAQLLLDGTDNLETRYLLNDVALEMGVPWIYAGVVGGAGLVLPVLPHRGPCLRCVFPEPPPAGTLDTCDTVGVILPAVSLVSSMAAGLALRLLGDVPGSHPKESANPALEPAILELDAWNGAVRRLALPRDPGCPACGAGERAFLDGPRTPEPIALCGRNTVQLPAGPRAPRLEDVARNLPGPARDVIVTEVLLRFSLDGMRVSLFRDGRALVEGTEDTDRARAVFDRAIGT